MSLTAVYPSYWTAAQTTGSKMRGQSLKKVLLRGRQFENVSSDLIGMCRTTIANWLANRRKRIRARELEVILSKIDTYMPSDILDRLRERADDASAPSIPLAILVKIRTIIQNQPVGCS